MDKITECVICCDAPVLTEKDNLSCCGHPVHLKCLQQQFKSECPFCRARLNIKVFGQRPVPDPLLFTDPSERHPSERHPSERHPSERHPSERDSHQGNIAGFRFEFSVAPGILSDVIEQVDSEQFDETLIKRRRGDSDDEEDDHGQSWKKQGYQYAEEDPDYDEENPHGDNCDYGDYEDGDGECDYIDY